MAAPSLCSLGLQQHNGSRYRRTACGGPGRLHDVLYGYEQDRAPALQSCDRLWCMPGICCVMRTASPSWCVGLSGHSPARTFIFTGAPPANRGGFGAIADGAVEEAEQLRHAVILRLGCCGIVTRRILCEQTAHVLGSPTGDIRLKAMRNSCSPSPLHAYMPCANVMTTIFGPQISYTQLRTFCARAASACFLRLARSPPRRCLRAPARMPSSDTIPKPAPGLLGCATDETCFQQAALVTH